MVPIRYHVETYICSYLRVAMVAKMLTPNITQAMTTSTATQVGRSAYSKPFWYPPSRVTTALRMITFHKMEVATPSFSLHSLTPQRRGTM